MANIVKLDLFDPDPTVIPPVKLLIEQSQILSIRFQQKKDKEGMYIPVINVTTISGQEYLVTNSGPQIWEQME